MAKSTSRSKSVSLRTLLITTAILLAFLGLGGYLVQRGVQSLDTALKSTTWPTTQGIVTRSTVREFASDVRENGRVVPNRKSRTYSPDIEYRYTVGGLELTGTRISIEDASIGTRASSQTLVDEYPVGRAVTVSYEPVQPSNSVLEPGNWLGTYRWFLPGAALVLIPLLLLRGIWSGPTEPTLTEVKVDKNHPARIRLLSGTLMLEEILCWEPGKEIHLHRPRVGFVKSIAGGVLAGFLVGGPLGLIPAIFFLSGNGIVFIAKFYLLVSMILSVAFSIGLLLHGRSREFLLDWSLESIMWEIGWNRQEAPLAEIERLTLFLPPAGGQPNPVVDSYRIGLHLRGKTCTLLETNGNDLSQIEVREKLTRLISELAETLNVPWTEHREKSTRPS